MIIVGYGVIHVSKKALPVARDVKGGVWFMLTTVKMLFVVYVMGNGSSFVHLAMVHVDGT